MKLEDFQRAEAELERVLETWRELGNTDVPDSLRDAITRRWELSVDALALGAVLAYGEEERRVDFSRVMPFRDALQILQTFEETLVREQVLDPVDLIWNRFRGVGDAIAFLVRNAGHIWTATLRAFYEFRTSDDVQPFDVLEQLLTIIFVTLSPALTVAQYATTAEKMLRARDAAIKKARSKAFPQSRGPRFYRRKVARL